jgi:elongation factor Ts
MTITTEDIKALRDKTGVSVMQCKKALEEAKGDTDKALALLQKKGGEIANKKSDRALGAGVVASYIHSNGSVGVLMELACETDFVAKNEGFVEVAHDIAMHIAAMYPMYISEEDISDDDRAKAKDLFEKEVAESDKPKDIKEKMMEGKLANYFGERVLLDQSFIKDGDLTIRQLISNATQKFGERIEVVRFKRFVVGGE